MVDRPIKTIKRPRVYGLRGTPDPERLPPGIVAESPDLAWIQTMRRQYIDQHPAGVWEIVYRIGEL
jgi:hypothetical protein